MSDLPPLIVTAALDEGALAWFGDLRQSFFPRHRSRVPGHLTLFHLLPSEHERAIVQALRAACQSRRPLPIDFRSPWSLGRGVAHRLASPDLEALRKELALALSPWLTRRDQAPYRPHVTVQNKVEPDEAHELLAQLQMEFELFEVFAEGLLLWRPLGGPWALIERFEFDAAL